MGFDPLGKAELVPARGGDERSPQLRAMCATFTVLSDRGVKPLQCLERLVAGLLSAGRTGEAPNREEARKIDVCKGLFTK